MPDFTVSSDCDILGRAMNSVEDCKTILLIAPPPLFCRAPSRESAIPSVVWPKESRRVFQRLFQWLLCVALVAGLATAAVQDAAAQSPSLVLTPTSLEVPEAGSASYTVKLLTQPSADVMVSIGGTSGTDLSLNKTGLTFTTSNWNMAQTVTVSAVEDSDATDDSATLTHTASGGGYGTVSADLPVTVTDTTTMRLEAVVENVPEGESRPIRAMLPMTLDEDVTITVTVAPNGGRADEYELSANTTLTIASGTTESTGDVMFTSLDDFTYTGTRYFNATLTSDHPRVDADTEPFAVVDDDNTPTGWRVTPSTIFENGGETTLLAFKTGLHEGVVKMAVSLEPSDRATLSGTTLTFEPGAIYATETLTITAVDNAEDEPDQTITISATVTEGRGIRTPGPLALTIVDDDGMSPELALVLTPPRVREGLVSTVTAVASGPLDEEATITVSASPGHADTRTDDYVLSANTVLRIPKGGTRSTGTVTIGTVDSELSVGNRRRVVEVSGTVTGGGGVADPADQTLTVLEDDLRVVVFLMATPATIGEGEVSTITMRAVKPVPADVSVTVEQITEYDAAGLSANKVLTIAEGETESMGAVTLTAMDDTDMRNEVVALRGTPSPASQFVSTGRLVTQVYILDDDATSAYVVISPVPSRVTEGETSTINAYLSQPLSNEVTLTIGVDEADSNHTATSDEYALSANRTLTISAGQTRSTGEVTLMASNDEYWGPLSLRRVALAIESVAGIDRQDVLEHTDWTISEDEDQPRVTLEVTPASISENGGQSTVTARLNTKVASDVEVTISAAPAGTTESDDFTQTGTQLTILADAKASTGTVTISAVDDAVDGPDKKLVVTGTVDVVGMEESGLVWHPYAEGLTIRDDDETPEQPAAVLTYRFHVTNYSITRGSDVVGERKTGGYVGVLRDDDPDTLEGGETVESDTTFTLTWNGRSTDELHPDNPTSVTIKAGQRGARFSLKAAADDDDPKVYNQPVKADVVATLGALELRGQLVVCDDESLPVVSVSVPETVEEGDAFRVTATLAHRLDVDTSVPIVVENPSEMTLQGIDGPYPSIRIPAGEISGETGDIRKQNDGDPDGYGDLYVSVNGISPYQWWPSSNKVKVRVTDDESTDPEHRRYAGTPRIFTACTSATEGSGADTVTKMPITVFMYPTTRATVTVDYRTVDESAKSGVNYTSKSGTLTFGRHEKTKTIEVDILNDGVGVHTRFGLVLENPTGGEAEAQPHPATCVIYDEKPTLVTYDESAHESGDGTATDMTFTVSLSFADENATYTVDYATTDGTARAGSDYTATSGTLTFAPGESQKEVTVPVLDDEIQDSGETFSFILSNPTGGAQLHAWKSTRTGTILNTDPAAALTATFPESRFASASHSGSDDRPQVVVTFSEAVTGVSTDTPSVTVTGASIASVQAHTEEGLENAWMFFLNPDGDGDVTFTLVADAACASGGICTAGGTPLTQAPTVLTIPGPGGTDDASLSASFEKVPASHDGTATFTFEVEFSEAPDVGYQRMRDHAFTVAGGSVKNARRVVPPSNLEWEITVEPSGNDDVTITLKTTADCDASDAICTSGGTPLTAVPATLTIPGPDADDGNTDGSTDDATVTDLTASFGAMPSEHAGPGTEFVFQLTFSENPELSYITLRDHAFTVTGGEVRRAQRRQQGSNVAWNITVEPSPSGWGDIAISLPGGRACTSTGGVCMADNRQLSNSPSGTVQGPAALSVADANAQEGTDPTLDFEVTLSRAAGETVTVDYATSDGTATSGADYTATSDTLTFLPGETEKTVNVTVLNDTHDDGGETVTLTLSNPSGARIRDAEATGTIENSDPLPKAWLARFGRTVANHVVEAVRNRMSSVPEPSRRVTLGGKELRQPPSPEITEISPWDELVPEDQRPENLRSLRVREFLLSSSFELPLAQNATQNPGSGWTAWGGAAQTRFSGRDSEVSIDGDVTTATLGVDRAWNRLLAGLALARSTGDGSYNAGDIRGDLKSSITSAHPYLRFSLNDRLSVWTLLGYGKGELTLTHGGGEERTDIEMKMAALGARGALLASGGFDLSARTDALLVRTSSEGTSQMAKTEADVTRLRLVLEGSRPLAFASGSSLTPSVELGVRRDGGDAESGMGFEVGGGMRYANPSLGLTVEITARRLMAHERSGYSEWGAGGSVQFAPGGVERGFSAKLGSSVGTTASGVEGLWAMGDTRGLAGGAQAPGRLDAEAGYAMGAFGDSGVITPYGGFSMSGDRKYRAGWRLRLGDSFNLSLEGDRTENPDAPSRHGVALRGELRW